MAWRAEEPSYLSTCVTMQSVIIMLRVISCSMRISKAPPCNRQCYHNVAIMEKLVDSALDVKQEMFAALAMK